MTYYEAAPLVQGPVDNDDDTANAVLVQWLLLLAYKPNHLLGIDWDSHHALTPTLSCRWQ
jgi:hypothetical protein